MFLLDANVLIALCIPEHVHHDDAMRWLASLDLTPPVKPQLALCAITEGALVRQMLRENPGAGIAPALTILRAVKAWPGCQFLSDNLSYADIDWRGVMGHKQVTDAYLVSLATSHSAQLATFDRALAALRPAQTTLVPVK